MNGQPNGNFKGYLSAEGKKRYSIRVGVICGVVPLLQIVIPYALMIPMMMIRFGEQTSYQDPSLEKSVLWRGAIWYVTEPYTWKEDEAKPALMKLTLGEAQKPVKVADLPSLRPWLLVDDGKLRIVSPAYVGYADGDAVFMEEVPEPLESMSRPFQYEGKPAALEGADDGINLCVLESGGWVRRSRLAEAPEDSDYTVDKYQLITTTNKTCVFHYVGNRLYFRWGLSLSRERTDWDLIGRIDHGYFYLTRVGDDPVIFSKGHDKKTQEDGLYGLRLRPASSEIILKLDDPPDMGQYALFPADDGSFLVVSDPWDEGITTFKIKNNAVSNIQRHGPKKQFPAAMVISFVLAYGLMLAAPLVMVLLVAWMMRKYRTTDYAFESQTMRFATVTRRAFAYLVDSLIIAIPAIAVWTGVIWDAIRSASTSSESPGPVLLTVLIGFLLTITILLAGLFLFSFLEGKYGQTPGKRLFRIKVLGTELKPCGFGRAIFRNLLLLADGFWNGLLGIAFIAYTENWQRVGDLAARTVVVDLRDEAGN